MYDGDIQIFMVPPHRMVLALMDNLFNWMNEVKEKVNPLILSSISNEFIEFMLKVINEAVDGMIVTSSQETTQKNIILKF